MVAGVLEGGRKLTAEEAAEESFKRYIEPVRHVFFYFDACLSAGNVGWGEGGLFKRGCHRCNYSMLCGHASA